MIIAMIFYFLAIMGIIAVIYIFAVEGIKKVFYQKFTEK
jgi:hypothetical protein